MEETIIRPIARYYGDLGEKFGVPRQAGVVEELEGSVIFEPQYRDPEALRGIEGFDRLWLIWQFSENLRDREDWSPTVRPPRLGGNTRMGVFATRDREDWSPTVRPPRLGGNTRMGVFATRSPFRPNALGLSCVRLLGIEQDREKGTVLRIGGADLVSGTPIFDIKPYIPYADAHPEARSGFAPDAGAKLTVEFPPALEALVPAQKRRALRGVLANDPRPRYQNDPERVYGLNFAGQNVKFTVEGDRLTVRDVEKREA